MRGASERTQQVAFSTPCQIKAKKRGVFDLLHLILFFSRLFLPLPIPPPPSKSKSFCPNINKREKSLGFEPQKVGKSDRWINIEEKRVAQEKKKREGK